MMKIHRSFASFLLGLVCAASLIPSLAEVISFSNDATLFDCPSTLRRPTQLSNFSGGKILISPTISEGDLCILTRVNRNVTHKVYIPISRSYDGNDWHRIQGRYISYVSMRCGEANVAGLGYDAGEYLCEIDVPELMEGNLGYFLTKWEEGIATNKRAAARFLERATWGAKWDDIVHLESEIDSDGKQALAQWVKTQQSLTPSSHRKFFRERLNPRTVESYQYGIPGPKACEKNARFRKFAFTQKDLELSRGNSGHKAGNTGLPFTPVEIERIALDSKNHWVLKFGGNVRTILELPPTYIDDGGKNIELGSGNYTICHIEEVVGNKIGNYTFTQSLQFQLLVGDICTSSYTNRGGVEDGKGDGATSSENIKMGNTLVRMYDKNACDVKCEDATKVKLIQGGNPSVTIPNGFDISTLSWIDLSSLNSSEILNINAERTHDSSWLLTRDLDSCVDQNGNTFPEPARLANTDYFSYGNGKYNLAKPIFALLPDGSWALHDFRTQFKSNTPDNPMEDGGGATMIAAARSGDNDDGNPDTDLVVRCSNVQRNVFNEATCRISYHEDACTSVPLPDPDDFFRSNMHNPGDRVDELWKYLPTYSGPDSGGVIVCGSDNEIASDPAEDDHFDVTNRKVEPGPIDYEGQKTTAWIEVVLAAEDQLCQRLAFGLSKIFATSTTMNADSFNTETNIGVYDNFVVSCFSTYRDVMKKVSFNQEMSEQLTYKHSKSVADAWHRTNGAKLAWPDENYARENLQLHSIGLIKLNEDGTPVLDSFGEPVANYEQKHIFSAAKIWTSFKESFRRGNYEDLDFSINSYIDPLQINDVSERDWFPKITIDGYLGDGYPLCANLPERHFLKQGATFRLLGGSTVGLSRNDPLSWEGDEEVHRLKLQPDSSLYQTLCKQTNAPPPSSTLTAGSGIAIYAPNLLAPFCEGSNSSCDSGDILTGRATEVNGPNTIDGCLDGDDSTYTESVKRIIVSSLSGDNLRGGDLVKIEATIISFAKLDRVDFYYASNATAPEWKFITIVAPITGEANVQVPYTRYPDVSFTLPKCLSTLGCQQAVRVVLRSSRDPSEPSKSSARNSDGMHKPDSDCATSPFDDVDDLVFDVLPSPRPKDICSFDSFVQLDSNLECHGRECVVSTLRVVEVAQGVFYEYLHLPCVNLPFFNSGVKVFSGSGNDFYMCADKRIASARSTCCGTYSDRGTYSQHPNWADVLSEYRGERLTYAQNEARCSDWGLSICDPERIGPFSSTTGQCQYHQSCLDVQSSDTFLTNNAYHWTTASCGISIKINPDGLVAILHNPEDKWTQLGSDEYPKVQSHVNKEKAVSYFHVQWDTSNVAVGKLEYPHISDNFCDGGTIMDEFCICDTDVVSKAVFDYLPTREDVLTKLFVGAYDPKIFEASYTAVVETNTEEGVSVYKRSDLDDVYSTHTIFRVRDKYTDDYIFRKNLESTVFACNGTFFYRNAPTFYDIVDPQLLSAYHEVDAYLDYVDQNSNTPPHVCLALSKHFGYSNPSPQHIAECSMAYKTGIFIWNSSLDSISFGTGKRGDLKAVSASILLSPDALSSTLESDPYFGGLKEPFHKVMHVLRGLDFARSLSHRRTERLISKIAQDVIGQVPYGIPDQFGFFSPDYSPPGAHVESALVSPEAELLNMKYVIATQNALYALIQNGLTQCWGGIGAYVSKGVIQSCGDGFEPTGKLNFTPQGDTTSSVNVISQLSTILTSDRLDSESRSIIESVYSATLDSDGEEAALKAAEILIVSSAEFHATNNANPSLEERIPTPPPVKDENEPYKAVIHLNLFGGMDSMNLIVPHPDDCSLLYNEYKNARGLDLYLSIEELIKIDARTSKQPCDSFGVNAHLGQEFADLYEEGELIFFSNIGHLQKPVSATNFLSETKTQLFSHHTMEQESFKVDAFKQQDGTGILGRLTDILGNRMATSRIAIDGGSSNLIGDPTIGLKVDVIAARGPDQFYVNDTLSLKQIINKLNNATIEGSSSIHANFWSQSFVDSNDKSNSYVSMLDTVSDSSSIDASNGLGKQLNMIYKLIKLSESRGVNRDVFAVTMDGFDTHFDMKNILTQKFNEIGTTLRTFRDELVNIGMWNNVTLVVSSEMGRTITPNTSGGTDHGWGGHHFVLGGQLNGGRILGHHPDTYNSEWKYNTGRGAWIPTTSNEGMWYGIAQWTGIDSSNDLDYVLPNLSNFGCRLYSETDLYKGGTGKLPGCGGDVMSFYQEMLLSEPRNLSPNEQKRFCSTVYDIITDISTKCVILEQAIATRDVSRRLSNETVSCEATDLLYSLNVTYEISSDSSGVSDFISDSVNSQVFKAAAIGNLNRDVVCIQSAEVASTPTQSPSTSIPSATPSQSPSNSPSIQISSSPSALPPNLTQKPTTQSSTPSLSPTTFPTDSRSVNPSVYRTKPSVSPTVSLHPTQRSSNTPTTASPERPDTYTKLPSKSPSQRQSISPSISGVTIIMTSSFMWNFICSSQNDDGMLLFDALIIEKSIFDRISSQIGQSQSLDYVLMTKICDRIVPPHGASFAKGRWLQMLSLTEVVFTMEATEKCTQCGDPSTVANALFDNIKTILEEEISGGNLSKAIQSDSSGRINAMIDPGSTNSTFSIRGYLPSTPPTKTITATPNGETIKTKAPSSKTSKQPSKDNSTLSPSGTSPKASKSKVKSRKSSGQPSNSSSPSGISPKASKSKMTSSKSSKNSGQPSKTPKGDKKKTSIKKKRIPLSMLEGTVVPEMSHHIANIENGSQFTSSESTPSSLKTSAEDEHVGIDSLIQKHRVPSSSSNLNNYEVGA